MQKIVLLAFIAGLFFFTDCSNKNRKVYRETHYSSGKLKSYGFYIHDTIPIDTVVTLYESGKILYKKIFNNIGNSVLEQSYYENGVTHKIFNYKDGLANGFSYEYFESGKLKHKNFYYYDNLVGDSYLYYEDLNKIAAYAFVEWRTGRTINLVKYDSISSNPYQDERHLMYLDSLAIYKKKDENIVELRLLVSNPPFSRTVVYIDYLGFDSSLLHRDSTLGEPYYFNRKKVSNNLYIIKILGKQYDSLKNEYYEQVTRKRRVSSLKFQ